jgi:transcriptional activator of cad operon
MPTGNQSEALQIGEWLVNPALDTITKGNETQKLEPKAMQLLMCLADAAGDIVSVDRLLNEVWSGVVVGSASVYQAVSQLRKSLGDADPNPTYIVTIPRKGYRLIAPVRSTEPTPSPAISTPTIHTPQRRVGWLTIAGVVATAILVAGAVVWRGNKIHRLSASATNSIVVLPFVDMTPEKADQSFCDGLTEELSNWLAQIPTLRVVARTSAFAFRDKEIDVRGIGKALDTDHVVEGSMRRSGDHMRITVQLIDARTGFHLWSEDFDRPLADAIKIQEDVSRSVAQALRVRLTSDSERQLVARRTDDKEAYQLYLLARHYQQLLTLESTDRAIDLYRQVIMADPMFSLAYVQLARALINRGSFRGEAVAEVASKVEPLVDSALRLDDRLSSAYAVRGALRSDQSRPKEALADLALAISINPSDMGALAEIGRIRLFNGQPRESLKFYDRAAALDPLNHTLQEQRCTVLGDLAQYAEAMKACRLAQTLQPDVASTADRLAWLAESQGHLDQALRWNAEAIKVEPDDDFDLYWRRATFFLAIGLAKEAQIAVDRGLAATKDSDDAKIARIRIVYYSGGAEALRKYMESVGLEPSTNALTLFEAGYSRLLLGEPAAAKQLIARAIVAPDRVPGFAELPFYARGERAVGTSYRVDLAVADLALGDPASAQRELSKVLEMLNRMIADGVERNATYELRAKVYALQGKGDAAMHDLAKAADLGWRRVWWATHEPYFASLSARADFQALMSVVSASNDRMQDNIRLDN